MNPNTAVGEILNAKGSSAWSIGPGQVFGEASYGVARVSTPEFSLDAGGLSFDLGYRIGIF